jgi:hypothetical protein
MHAELGGLRPNAYGRTAKGLERRTRRGGIERLDVPRG